MFQQVLRKDGFDTVIGKGQTSTQVPHEIQLLLSTRALSGNPSPECCRARLGKVNIDPSPLIEGAATEVKANRLGRGMLASPSPLQRHQRGIG